MKKLVITCHPTLRSTDEGMRRILFTVRDLAVKCGVGITWKEELECGHPICLDPAAIDECQKCTRGSMP